MLTEVCRVCRTFHRILEKISLIKAREVYSVKSINVSGIISGNRDVSTINPFPLFFLNHVMLLTFSVLKFCWKPLDST